MAYVVGGLAGQHLVLGAEAFPLVYDFALILNELEHIVLFVIDHDFVLVDALLPLNYRVSYQILLTKSAFGASARYLLRYGGLQVGQSSHITICRRLVVVSG